MCGEIEDIDDRFVSDYVKYVAEGQVSGDCLIRRNIDIVEGEELIYR